MCVSFCRKSVSWYTKELFRCKDNRNHRSFQLDFLRPLLNLKQSSHEHALWMKRMGTKVFIAVYFYLVIFTSSFLPKSTPSLLPLPFSCHFLCFHLLCFHCTFPLWSTVYKVCLPRLLVIQLLWKWPSDCYLIIIEFIYELLIIFWF